MDSDKTPTKQPTIAKKIFGAGPAKDRAIKATVKKTFCVGPVVIPGTTVFGIGQTPSTKEEIV
jgi:hypothetical protein